MKLQKGITRFDATPVYEQEDLIQILKKIKHPFLKQGELNKPNESSNFYQQKIKDERTKKEFYLIVNSTYLIFACVENSRCFDLRFIDFPVELITQLKQEVNSSLTLLNRKDLIQNIEKEDLADLSTSEINQIKYWNTNLLGEIVFNCFD
jgi:hypothetical protein